MEYSDDQKIGNSTDTASAKTILGYNNSLYQHIHNPALCYPTLADGVVVAGGASPWALGNAVEVIPTNTITTKFDIHYINFEDASASDSYELHLFKGAAGNESLLAKVRTKKDSTVSNVVSVPIQIEAQDANTRISAKLASKSGGDSVTISVYYHAYS